MKTLQIEFLSEYDLPGYDLYRIRITNPGNKPVEYDAKKIKCSSGKNVLSYLKVKDIYGHPLLTQGKLKKGESIEGLICLVKSGILSTDSPKFTIEGERIGSGGPKGKKEKLERVKV